MAAKKSSKNAMKKIDKQLDILLKDKKEIEDIPVVDRKEIDKAVKEKKKNNVKKSNRKSDALVVRERGRKNSKNKKEGIVAPSRKKKENFEKKQKKVKVSESTMRLQKLESEIRSLYDKVEDVVEDIEFEKTVDTTEDVIISDIVIRNKESNEEDIHYDLGDKILNGITMFLFVIFMIMFIAFVCFVVYVCTY